MSKELGNGAVLCDVDARGVVTVTLNRPAVNNAYNEDMILGLHQAMDLLPSLSGARVVVVVAARNGAWANSESTPFGHGRPFSRRQLADLLRDADLEPSGWTRALYVPPIPWAAGWAEGFEQAGSRLWPSFAGLVLMEAVKQTFAVKPRGHQVRAPLSRPVLSPLPVGRAPVSLGCAIDDC
jgi:hypothetical protein